MNERELDLALDRLGVEHVRRTAPSTLRDRVHVVPLEIKRRSWLLPFTTWRLQSMFSATKFVVAGAIVALVGGLLLAGLLQQPSDEQMPVVGASASATAQDVQPMTSSVFALKLLWGDYRASMDPDTGLYSIRHAFEAILPDASVGWEEWDEWKDWDVPAIFPMALWFTTGPGDADPRALGEVTEVWAAGGSATSSDGIGVFIVRRSVRVENDGGAWVGTATVPNIGGGPGGTSFWELVGEGGYDGLTMFLWGDFNNGPDVLLGVIVPSGCVPAYPPLSASEPSSAIVSARPFTFFDVDVCSSTEDGP